MTLQSFCLIVVFLAIIALPCNTLAQQNGRLIIVGGALSNAQDDIFDALLKSEKELSKLQAAVIPAASSKPSFYGNDFRNTLIKRGLLAQNVKVLPLALIDDPSTDDIDESAWRQNANDEDIAAWLNQSDVVWFTGGDQSLITAVIKPNGTKTKVFSALEKLLARGGTLGGTSAGAAMMSETMIVGGSSKGAILGGFASTNTVNQEAGPLLLGKGLGFFKYGIIDQHFDAKARLGRLIIALTHSNEPGFGFGIDENTALIVELGTSIATVAGASQVTVVSKVDFKFSGTPIHIKNTRISSLGQGDTIHLISKKITPSEDKSATTGYEYYDIPSPLVSGIMSAYGNLNMLLTRLLLDNKASNVAISYLFSETDEVGYRLRFTRDEKSKGFWSYREGQVDHYTVINALLSIEPIEVKIKPVTVN